MTYATNGTPESGLHKAITFLGKVIGAGAAILLTPDVFNATHGAIYAQLRKMWSPDVANALTWVFGFLEGLAIYAVVWMGLTMAILAAVAAWAARRFKGGY